MQVKGIKQFKMQLDTFTEKSQARTENQNKYTLNISVIPQTTGTLAGSA